MPDSKGQTSRFFAGWSSVFTYGVLQSFLAFSFYYASYLALHTDFALDYGTLIIAGTLGVYNSHLLIKIFLNERRWSASHILILLILAIITAYFLFNFTSGIEYLRHLLIPFIIALLYLLPFSKIINSRFIPAWIKPVSLAIAWTWICTGPLKGLEFRTILYVTSIFFLILSNALIFDVKDMAIDRRSNKSTFANKYGWETTQLSAFISLIASMIAFGMFYMSINYGILIAPLLLSLYFIPLKKIKTDSPQYIYYWYLDGGLFLFPVIVSIIETVIKL